MKTENLAEKVVDLYQDELSIKEMVQELKNIKEGVKLGKVSFDGSKTPKFDI